MSTPDTLTAADIGKVVTYSSVVQKVDHYYRNDIERYSREGVLLLASHDEQMPEIGDLERPWGQHRLLIKQSLKNPQKGLLLGKSTRNAGRMWYEDEVGGVFDPDGVLPVAIVMPIDGRVGYRLPVAIVEWEEA